MKTEASEINYKYNSKPEIDDFWNDCMEQKEKKPFIITNNKQKANKAKEYNQYSQIKSPNYDRYQKNQYIHHGRNSNPKINKNANIRTYNSVKLFNQKNNANHNLNSSSDINNKNNNKLNSSTEKYLVNIYNKHPSYLEEMKEQENKKIKSKNALVRCLGLYAYGLELQKTMKMNKLKSDEEKMKNNMLKCTFKPKLNKKISYLDNKVNYTKASNNFHKNNNLKKFVNKSVDNINKSNNNKKQYESLEECTFKPKLESDPNAIKKLFGNKKEKNKTINDMKGNPEFILRYTKARDEYLIKRFKKLYRKDDSYDKSLLSLTKRLCNKQYRNYLNVNNTILLFGETISPDNQIHSSIANFRGFSIHNEIHEQNKSSKNNYIVGLRRNLHSLDLNEEEQ